MPDVLLTLTDTQAERLRHICSTWLRASVESGVNDQPEAFARWVANLVLDKTPGGHPAFVDA